jgi:hypothetical protein
VNSQDISFVRNNQSTGNNSVNVTSPYDLNRDGRVNSQDTSIVRNNQQTSGIVAPITAPSSSPPGPSFTPGGKNGSGSAPPVKSSGDSAGTTIGTIAGEVLNPSGEKLEQREITSFTSFPAAKWSEVSVASVLDLVPSGGPKEIDGLEPRALESGSLDLDRYFAALGLQKD